MNVHSLYRIGVFIVCVCVLSIPLLVFSAEEKSDSADNAKISRMIYIKKTKACACTAKRIQDGEMALKKAMKTLECDLPCKPVDVQTDIVETAKLKQQTKWNFLPVLVFLDKDDKLITTLQGFITEEKIIEIVKQHGTEKTVAQTEE